MEMLKLGMFGIEEYNENIIDALDYELLDESYDDIIVAYESELDQVLIISTDGHNFKAITMDCLSYEMESLDVKISIKGIIEVQKFLNNYDNLDISNDDIHEIIKHLKGFLQ